VIQDRADLPALQDDRLRGFVPEAETFRDGGGEVAMGQEIEERERRGVGKPRGERLVLFQSTRADRSGGRVLEEDERCVRLRQNPVKIREGREFFHVVKA